MSMAEDSKALSDEQVDQLNSFESVKLARINLLQKMAAYLKHRATSETPDLFLLEEVNQAEAEYETVFTERLREVIEHPPQPKSVATLSQDRLKGFKK